MARSSPQKKTKKQAVVTVAKDQVLHKPRRLPRCTHCPGNPLRSECPHTAKGKRFLLEQAALSELPSVAVPAENSPPEPCRLKIQIPPRAVRARHSSPALASFVVDPVLLAVSDLSTRPVSSPSANHSAPPILRIAAESSVQGFASQAGTLSPAWQSSDSSLFSPQSHATLRAAETPYKLNAIHTPDQSIASMNPSPLQDLLQPNAGYTLASTSLEDMVHTDQSVLSPDDMGPSSPANETNRRGNTCGQARNRATASSPIYGHVTGVLRGPDVVHEVYRTREKPSPVSSASLASKAFLEKMNALFNQCENVSLQTGCWLFIGAQHANATGKPLHYASPRLRKDGQQNTNDLATQFLQLIRQVTDARKVDVLELQNQLRRSENGKALMEESMIDVERKLKAAVDELEALKAKNQSEVQFLQDRRQNLGLAPN